MKLSTRLRYGTRAILELAKSSSGKPVPIQWIASKQNISPSYLEQLLARLRKAGIVKSLKGPGGGYTLAKKPEQISLLDIELALEGNLSIVKCLDDLSYCDNIDYCIARTVWEKMRDMLVEFLEKQKIADILEKEKELLKNKKNMRPRRVRRRK